jgi:hypothetical protein
MHWVGYVTCSGESLGMGRSLRRPTEPGPIFGVQQNEQNIKVAHHAPMSESQRHVCYSVTGIYVLVMGNLVRNHSQKIDACSLQALCEFARAVSAIYVAAL